MQVERKTKKWIIWLVLVVLLCGAVIAAVTGWQRSEAQKQAETEALARRLPDKAVRLAQNAEPIYPDAEYLVDPYVEYTYDQLLIDAQELADMYPGLIVKSTFGTTVEGREMICLRLGRGEREIILSGTIHGCEFFATNVLMNMIDRYAYGYAKDEVYEGYSYRELLNQVTLVFLPMLNPDGVNIAQNGPSAAADPASIYRMDLQDTWYNAWKANAHGVDINRNFPLLWSNYNGVTWPGARYYFGPSAASEPETQAIIKLLESVDYWMFADFHCYGDLIYWQENYNEITDVQRAFARKVLDMTGYVDPGMEEADDFGGYLQNYARANGAIFSMTVELGYYWGYNEADFDSVNRHVYGLGLLMADEVASMESRP